MAEQKPRSLLHYVLIAGVLLYAAVLLITPIGTLVGKAFEEGIQPILESLSHPDAIAGLRNTLSLVIAAALVNTVAGVAVAWVLVRHNFPGRGFLNALVDLPFVASPVIVGFVIIMLFGRTGWIQNPPFQIAFAWPGMLLVTLFVSLPFVVREVMPVLAAFTPEQEEAAYTLGASRFTTFRRVILPAIRHGVIYGVVLTAARALGEFGGVAAAGGGIRGVTETTTIYIFRSLSDRNDTAAYSLSLVLGVIAILILVVMSALKPHHAVQAEPDEE